MHLNRPKGENDAERITRSWDWYVYKADQTLISLGAIFLMSKLRVT